MAPAPAAPRTLGFGRFRTLTIPEVWHADPSYVAWLWRTFKHKRPWFLRDIQDVLDDALDDDALDETVAAVTEAVVDVLVIEAVVEADEQQP